MDTLKVIAHEDNTVIVENDSKMNFGEALGLCIDGLESLLTHAVKSLDGHPEHIHQLHDYMSYTLTSVIGRVFPESEQFSFTDAAVYKAQNELMEESMEKGVPIEELIQSYNDQAEKYVENVRRN